MLKKEDIDSLSLERCKELLTEVTELQVTLQQRIVEDERKEKAQAYLEFLFDLSYEDVDDKEELKRIFLENACVEDFIVYDGYCYRDIRNDSFRVPTITTLWLKDVHRIHYPDEDVWYDGDKIADSEYIQTSRLQYTEIGKLGGYVEDLEDEEEVLEIITANIHITLFDDKNIEKLFPKGCEWECFVVRNKNFDK